MDQRRIRVLIDGACPLCCREANIWRRLDRGRGRIVLEDISASDFDPARYGLTSEQAMGQIHGVLPSGVVIRGMDVFRQAYNALGWGWLVRPTAWPILKPLFDRAYRWFAQNRLRLTGRGVVCQEACPGHEPARNREQDRSTVAGGALQPRSSPRWGQPPVPRILNQGPLE